MSRDGERVIELLNELGSRVGNVLADVVPPSAQVHLLNAQRELITALMLIYENRVAPEPAVRRARRGRGGGRTATPERKIPVWGTPPGIGGVRVHSWGAPPEVRPRPPSAAPPWGCERGAP